MTNLGGRADEPTSYGLQPPAPGGHYPPGASTPVPQQAAYEPTQMTAPSGPPGRGHAGPGHAGQQDHPGYDGHDPHSGHSGTLATPTTPAAPQDPGAGRVIGGRYRLISRLGHGGMGTVWTAHDQVVDREVAVKEPRVPEHVPERERHTVHQRMQREARAAARIDHPSVVNVYDVVVEDGRPWIVMELVHGHSLADRLSEGTLDPREAARIGLAVLGALTAAHEAGVLHRDVKPDNVLLGRNDRVVLTDFGIAQVEGEQGLTETGAFIGSPEFIAPERVLGQRPGPESDLWSLGVVLYAAVEGMSPFRRSHTPATLQAILSAEPQAPARGSGALGTLVMRLLSKDPAARPAAAEVRRTLETVAQPPQPAATKPAAAPAAPADGGGSRFVPPILHKNRKAQLGLGAGVLMVTGALVLALANPFTTEPTMPAGWTVREDPELLSASLAVPKDYRREVTEGDDDSDGLTEVTFHDPSGVFTIALWRSEEDSEGPYATSLDGAAKELAEHYTGDNNYEMKAAKPQKPKRSNQQGEEARDLTTTYRDSGDDEDDPRYANRDHVYLNKDKTVWILTVTMPAAGDARKTGDRLFEDVVKNLKIDANQL
ncbi:serine/threonine-protein kinase [Streptomyces halobius]|uniref:non-specific serine/threonine protein kinase n=1 Tax=Streptomyces halobius TaxID=2879846 RepID=A0ABY4MJK2_9ACTN|nr:serine/threonine-protein kinase [Streptomyces halobius]UQA96899.1 protein kinase [Streptomyces halobius]